MCLNCISIDQQEEWNNALKLVGKYDFYHTWSYHKLSFENNEGVPLLIKYEKYGYVILFFFLKREIKGTNYFDYSSVYGYPSFLSNRLDLNNDIMLDLKESLLDFLNNEKIISIFCRLHPLFPCGFLKNIGVIEESGITVGLNLKNSSENIWRNYRKSLKSEINQLRKKHNVRVRFAKTNNDIEKFVDIYHENMRMVSANSYYFFDKSYFKEFLNATDFTSSLLLAEVNNKIIGGAIFTKLFDVCQYHLAATADNYRSLKPMKIILDEARKFYAEEGCSILHLGGGLGSDINSSLFRFKSGFSKDFYKFNVWKCIVNIDIYTQLSGMSTIDYNGFFPKYREQID